MQQQSFKNHKKKCIKQKNFIQNTNNNIIYPDYLFILNTLHDPVFAKDENHHWVFANDVMCKFLGKTKEELYGKTDYEIFPEEEAKVFWNIDKKILETGQEHINEEPVTVYNEITYYIRVRKTLHTDKNGNKFIIGTVMDITELFKAREAEKKYLKNLEFLAKTAIDFVELPVNTNIFDYIGEKLRTLINKNNSLILISSYNEKDNYFQIENIQGDYKKINDILTNEIELKINFKDIRFHGTPYIISKLSNGLLGEPSGLHEISGGYFSKEISDKIEKFFNIKYFYAIGLIYKHIIVGSIILCLTEELEKSVKEVIETFISQAAIAIQKNKISKELATSELKYRTIFDNILNVYFEIDTKGYIIEISPSVETYSFFKREELIGKHFKNIFTNISDYETFMSNLIKVNKLSDYEIKLTDKKGNVHFCLINIKTELNEYKKPIKYIGIINDISENKKIQQLLSKSEEKYRELLEKANDIIFTINLKGDLISINKSGEKIIGKKINNQNKKLNIKYYILPEDYKIIKEKFKLFLVKRTKKCCPTIILNAKTYNNKIITIEVNAYLHFKDNKPYEIFGIARDITERIANEQKLITSLAEKETLLSEIHHRVKNNMQIITSLINIQIKQIKEENLIAELTGLKNRVMAMSIVHEDLYMSKNLNKIDFSKLLYKLINNIILSYNNNNKITPYFNIQNASLNIDQAITCALIVNELVSNSIKHAFPLNLLKNNTIKPTINIKFKKLKNKCFLSIIDNGIGISDKNILNANSMGLNLVNMLVQNQLKGTIEINNNKGTTFTITFLCYEKSK